MQLNRNTSGLIPNAAARCIPPLKQIRLLQDVAFKTACDPKTAPQARAQLMRAWTDLEERKRILRMKPKPKDLDMSTLDKHSKRSTPRSSAPTPSDISVVPGPQAEPKAGEA